MTDAQTEARAIQRYIAPSAGRGAVVQLLKHCDGEWVRYEDHATALAAKDAELARLTHDWERQWLQERDLKCQTIDHAESLVTELAAAKLAQEANHNLAVANGNRAREEYERADRAEAQLAEARKALNLIDALDPEEHIYSCSHDATRGLVIQMGQIARRALEAQGGENG